MTHQCMKTICIPFLALALVACPVKDPPNVTDKITGIEASATPTSIGSGATSSLVATVSGTGTFNANVNWSIVSGGGSLSGSTGGSVTYTAPTVTSATTVQIKAAAVGDLNISKLLQISVQVVTPGNDPLVEANAWKAPIPTDAEQVSPDEFKNRVASGELIISSAALIEAAQKTRNEQFKTDKTLIESASNTNPYFKALANEAMTKDSFEGDRPVTTPGGETVVFGLGIQLRNAAQVYALSQDVSNAITDYTQTYNLLPESIKLNAATPESLNGKSLTEVQAALENLNTLLAGVPKLDGTRLETGATANQSAKTVSPRDINAGNGLDNDGLCTPTQLQKRYWFPLKSFVSPIKQQAKRGTCWAFSAIGALESRERVQNNNPANLSEQFLVNKVKQDWDNSDFSDGYWSDKALNTAVNKGQVFPNEAGWTYNPAKGRPVVKDGDSSSYANTCNNYSGTCSNTAHQSRQVCTAIPFPAFTFCSYVKATYSGAGVAASRSYQVWANGQNFNLNRYRLLLSQGYVLMASFPVYKGFMDDAVNGFVTNYAKTFLDNKGVEMPGSYGGHVVQIVGFLDNDTLSTFGVPSNIGGGGYFIIKNSWGCAAGDGGYYYVPADYVSSLFGSLDALDFDGRRSDAWNKEQATPGGADAPKIEIKSNPALVDLRVSKDIAKFFLVSHTVAKSVNLTISTDNQGIIYNGPWSTDTNALFGPSFKYTFTTPGQRTLSLTAKYGSLETRANFLVNVVNTPPTLELQSTGDARQGEAFPITALITDINEADLGVLCTNTTWAVDAPDTLLNAAGCLQKVTFGTTGSREVRVSTMDSEGVTVSKTLTLNVLPPPENPYPKITSTSLNSREFVFSGGFNFCTTKGVGIGTTIDLTQKGCEILPVPGQPEPNRYFVGAAIDNPTNEVLTYDWSLYVTGLKEYILYSEPGSSKNSFELGAYGNSALTTTNCRVTLKVNAPDPARSKSLTVWTGNCKYYAVRVN